MNDNTKLEIAQEIMANKIAKVAREKKGIIDKEMKQLLKERVKMYSYDTEIIEKIINEYGKELKDIVQEKDSDECR